LVTQWPFFLEQYGFWFEMFDGIEIEAIFNFTYM
jgi:hypothetical protein